MNLEVEISRPVDHGNVYTNQGLSGLGNLSLRMGVLITIRVVVMVIHRLGMGLFRGWGQVGLAVGGGCDCLD